jgi:FG-GAP-like repeat/PASTA domain/FG-GAP repeat
VKTLAPLASALVLSGSVGVAALFAASAPSFAGPKSYATGTNSQSVAIGDLNGDGKPDLVTANLEARTVSVLANRGQGTFRAKLDYGTGANPISVAVGDLNGDGKLDVATANAGENVGTVSVLLNRGDGGFQAGLDYATGGDNRSVAIGDLNGDGKLDLATANGGVSVLLNRGDGSFLAGVEYEAGRVSHSVAIGDVNGDGKPDLAVANLGLFTGTVSVLLNSGDGTFQAKRDYETGKNASSVAIGDLNGDGKPDLAAAIYGTDSVSVLANSGDGTFQARRDYATARGPVSVAIGDLNGDAKPDLATADVGEDAGAVSVLANKGDGTFQARLDQTERGADTRWVAISDLNGDGRLDLATADGDSDTVSVRTNTTGACKVPNVRGKTLPAAKRAIARGHCGVGTIRRVYSKTVKKGRVISEQPKPGTVLYRGKVSLVVSRGRRRS